MSAPFIEPTLITAIGTGMLCYIKKRYDSLQLIELFLLHASLPRSVYLLGAGASVPIVPAMKQLTNNILNEVKSFGSFSTDEYPYTSFRKAIGVYGYNKKIDPWDLWYAKCTNENALKLLAYNKPMIDAHEKVLKGELQVPNYEFFKLIPPCHATIININTDGLINLYAPHLEIIEPHGSILNYNYRRISPIKLVTNFNKTNKEWKDIIVDYDIPVYSHSHVYAGETGGLEFKPEEEKCSKALRNAQSVFIIGYSFPDYDIQLKNLFYESLNVNNNAIFVFDLYKAKKTVEELRYELKKDNIYPCEFDWHKLSSAILMVANGRGLSFVNRAKDIIRVYDR